MDGTADHDPRCHFMPQMSPQIGRISNDTQQELQLGKQKIHRDKRKNYTGLEMSSVSWKKSSGKQSLFVSPSLGLNQNSGLSAALILQMCPRVCCRMMKRKQRARPTHPFNPPVEPEQIHRYHFCVLWLYVRVYHKGSFHRLK